MNILSEEEIAPRSVLIMRVLSIICLVSVPIVVILLIIIFHSGFQSIFLKQDPTINIVELVFSVLSVIILSVGFTTPKLFKWSDRQRTSFRNIVISQIFRVSLFETLPIYGFILGILGSTWYVVGIFILFAAIAFIATYPTNSRIAKWKI